MLYCANFVFNLLDTVFKEIVVFFKFVPTIVPELDPVPTQDNGLPGNDEPVDVIPGQTSD